MISFIKRFFKKIIIPVIFFSFITGCTKKQENRFIVLSNGENPVVLDTKTNEIYTVIVWLDRPPTIYKTPLNSASDK